MVFVRTLSEAERRALHQGVRREVGRVSERMRAVLLSARGYPVPQIARIFECEEATVREWLARFEADGIGGLVDRPRSGRAPRAGAAARERLGRMVEAGPASVGYAGGVWTTLTLALYLTVRESLTLSCASLRRLLHTLGFRWRRPKLVLPTDPAARQTMDTLATRLWQASADAVVLCLDECDVHLLPVLRAMWMRRGQQAHVMTPGTNRKRGIFGALAWETGAWHYTVTDRKRAVDFVAFLDQLLAAYPAVPLYLVLDNASIHTAKLVRAWCAAHGGVQLCFLPKYAGHRENPVEKVWWRLKQQVLADRLYGDIEQVVAAVHRFFGCFTTETALQLAA
jgi:transposase